VAIVGALISTRAAGDDTTDRAHLHPRIVDRLADAVYSLWVLGPEARLERESDFVPEARMGA
jgi:hypothetical protein